MKPVVLVSAIMLSACTMSQAQPDVPAVIAQPTADSRAELLAVVASALNVSSITLADDALTQSSTLIVERARARDASGRQLSGRDLEKPQHFHLVKSGKHCVLVQDATGRRFELQNTNCEAQSQARSTG